MGQFSSVLFTSQREQNVRPRKRGELSVMIASTYNSEYALKVWKVFNVNEN